MAGVKISALPVSPGLDGTEIVPIVDGGITRRTTVNAIVALASGSVDLSDYEGAVVSITVTDPDNSLTFEMGSSGSGITITNELIALTAEGEGDNIVSLNASGADAVVNIVSGGGINLDGSAITLVGNAESELILDTTGSYLRGGNGATQLRLENLIRFTGTDQTGVAVTAGAIHAALVNLGLITA